MQAQATHQRDFEDEEQHGYAKKEPNLDDLNFRDCPRFKGAQGEWDNWFHAFTMCCHKPTKVQEEIDAVLSQAGNNVDS